jgi:hypothetical protein
MEYPVGRKFSTMANLLKGKAAAVLHTAGYISWRSQIVARQRLILGEKIGRQFDVMKALP